MNPVWHCHVLANRLQSVVLILVMIALLAIVGGMLFGEEGLWMALTGAVLALLLEPVASSHLTLRLYHAKPIATSAAPQLWGIVRALAERAGLPAVPALHYVPSPVLNAFVVGNARNSAIALSDGLLRSLSQRRLAGVIAHEVAHIVCGDLRVMGLADYLSRLTNLLALTGIVFLLAAMPLLIFADVIINWPALLLLALTPHLALLAQMGLSCIRELKIWKRSRLQATQQDWLPRWTAWTALGTIGGPS